MSARNRGPRIDRETGKVVLPEGWSEFIDWLLDSERDPKTQQEWAVLHGFHPDSLGRWKRNPEFVREWEARARLVNVGVERTQAVVNALFGQAVNGDTKAASLYLQFVDKFTPKQRITVEDGDVEGLSDEDLVLELERLHKDLVGFVSDSEEDV